VGSNGYVDGDYVMETDMMVKMLVAIAIKAECVVLRRQ
jgi:hypothetical protein